MMLLSSLHTYSSTLLPIFFFFFFFFNDTATTEIYTLSLHDGSSDLHPAQEAGEADDLAGHRVPQEREIGCLPVTAADQRSEEHTSELQSRLHLVCRLLLEKKKKQNKTQIIF